MKITGRVGWNGTPVAGRRPVLSSRAVAPALTWRMPQESAPAAEFAGRASARDEGALEAVLDGWETRDPWATAQR